MSGPSERRNEAEAEKGKPFGSTEKLAGPIMQTAKRCKKFALFGFSPSLAAPHIDTKPRLCEGQESSSVQLQVLFVLISLGNTKDRTVGTPKPTPVKDQVERICPTSFWLLPYASVLPNAATRPKPRSVLTIGAGLHCARATSAFAPT